jgi:NhaP-type Na+/H+ or K+/H+ antiporter
MLIGFIIQINLSLNLFLKAALVFAVLVLVRFLATSFLKFNTKEKVYISLNMPKGIAVAVLVFSLSFLTNLEGIAQINELIIIIMIYSLIVSSLINKYSQKFIRVKLD